jgi:hypothetical protein
MHRAEESYEKEIYCIEKLLELSMNLCCYLGIY